MVYWWSKSEQRAFLYKFYFFFGNSIISCSFRRHRYQYTLNFNFLAFFSKCLTAVLHTFVFAPQVSFMKTIAESAQLDDVIQRLQAIGQHVLNRHKIRCSINATPQTMDQAVKQTEQFVGELAQAPPTVLTHDDFFVQV